MLTQDHINIACGEDKYVVLLISLVHGGHLTIIQGSQQSTDGVKLGDDYSGPEILQGPGTPLAHVSIACYHCHLAHNHHICGPLKATCE